MLPSKSTTVLLLIDTDNMSYRHLPKILEHIQPLGNHHTFVVGKENNLKQWRKHEQESNFTVKAAPDGKNATDELLKKVMEYYADFHQNITTYCIVSNDSDFVNAAKFLRQQRKRTILLATQHAAKTLQQSCDEFIPLSIPVSQNTLIDPLKTKYEELKGLLATVFTSLKQEWLDLGKLGKALKALQADFKPKNYGKSKLSKLLEAMPDFIELHENKARLKRL